MNRSRFVATLLCAVTFGCGEEPVAQQKQNPARLAITQETAVADALQKAESLQSREPLRAMQTLEEAIAAAPSSPTTAPLLLRLGILKREFEKYHWAREGEAAEAQEKRAAEFAAYAKARPEEYWYNEIGGDYLYSGFHLKEIEKRFPRSPLVVDADYELTKLTIGGECEGYVTCYISAKFTPVLAFLQKHPASKYSAEAVRRADEAFRSNLWGEKWRSEFAEITDPHKDVEGYEAAQLKRMVQDYEDLAPTLPRLLRASATETVAYYRARFGEAAKAREHYTWIITHAADYQRIADVRKALAALR